MIMNQHIGEQLKKARESKKMRQEDMALKLGISSRQYQKYEDGIFPKFKGEAVRRIDSILGTNFYELIYEQGVLPIEETKKPAPANEEGLKEDLIAALKMNNALLEARVKELEARTAPPPSTSEDIADRLSKIQNENRELLVLVLESQRYLLKQQTASPKKYLEALRTIQRTALDSLEKDLQWNMGEGTDDN